MSSFGAIIAGTGSCLPEKRLTNDDLSKMVDTNDEWITKRTGIKERRIAGENDSTASLGLQAARRALEASGLQAKDLDLIVVATITSEMVFPSTACFIAKELGLTDTPAFDLQAACSGFLFALEVGAQFVRGGRYRNVLVIGAETITKITDYKDRGSCILFGDGAGAVVLQQSPDPKQGWMYGSLHADGNGWQMLYCPPGSRHPVTPEMIQTGGHFMKLNGREVYKFAVSRFEELILDAMNKCGLSIDDVALIVPHQVNQRIIDSAIEKIGFPMDRVFVNIERYGNTSSASIPIALDEAVRSGRAKKGDVLLFVAFGAGLTWANAAIRL
jgi:3-oxoacyl-[acyl-carrier-protein] synthase III